MVQEPDIFSTADSACDSLNAGAADAKLSDVWIARFYDELRAIAWRELRRTGHHQTLQPTALVHEVLLRFAHRELPDGLAAERFPLLAARVMRQILVERWLAKRTVKRGIRWRRVPFDCVEADSTRVRRPDPVHLDEALELLARFDRRKARVVELRAFGGYTTPEIAELLQVTVRTVERDWQFARAWLRVRLGGS